MMYLVIGEDRITVIGRRVLPPAHQWPEKDQCEIIADTFFGTKCTDLASWLIAGQIQCCTMHLSVAAGMAIVPTDNGKVTLEHYTS